MRKHEVAHLTPDLTLERAEGKSPRGVLPQRAWKRTRASPSKATVLAPDAGDLEQGVDDFTGSESNSNASGEKPNHTASGENGGGRPPTLQRASSPHSTASGEGPSHKASGEKETKQRLALQRASSAHSAANGKHTTPLCSPRQRPTKKKTTNTATSRGLPSASVPAPYVGDLGHAVKTGEEILTVTKETFTHTKTLFNQPDETFNASVPALGGGDLDHVVQPPPVAKRIKIARLVNDHDLDRLLAAEGMDEMSEAFLNEDIFSVEAAASLGQAELRKILEGHGIVASIGLLHRLVTIFQEGLCKSRLVDIVPTGNSVLTRSMLQLQPENLKNGLVERFNAETLFATLMFSVAAIMLSTTPQPETCLNVFLQQHCGRLRCTYMVCWGLASAFFSNATLVTMGSVGLFFGHASLSTIHGRFIGAERYMAISRVYIGFGIIFGLLPGSCVNIVLRFPQFPGFVIALSAAHWLMWLHQFIQAFHAVAAVYSDFPGYVNAWQVIRGYVDLRGRSLTHSLKRASLRSRMSCAHNMDV